MSIAHYIGLQDRERSNEAAYNKKQQQQQQDGQHVNNGICLVRVKQETLT